MIVKPRHLEKTIGLLEQELDALEQRRGAIVRAIETLRPLAGGRATKALKTDGRSKPRATKRGPYKKRTPKEAP